MLRLLILLSLLTAASDHLFAQRKTADSAANTQVTFPGGEDSLEKFINNAKQQFAKYYARQAKLQAVEGLVAAQITIDTSGKIYRIAITEGTSDLLNGLTQDIMMMMPDWIPAYQHGSPVFSKVTLNIYFEMAKDTVVSVQNSDTTKSAYFNGNLLAFLNKNLTFPDVARNQGKAGGCYVQFVIDESGNVRWVIIKQSSGVKALDDEAMRVIKLTNGLWKPAIQNGRPVRFMLTQLIRFSLN